MSNRNTITIKLPRKIRTSHQIKKWEELWRQADNASYSIPEDLSVDEIREYFSLLMNRLPDDFASVILGEIAELKNTPWDLLEELFEKGNTDSMVSICCRPDLPDSLVKKCLSSSNLDVLEHVVFHEKVSIHECESLLQGSLEKSTIEAIQRAIAQKMDGKPIV